MRREFITILLSLALAAMQVLISLEGLKVGSITKIFDRLGLPVKIYALKGKSDGIAYRRYEKNRPNAQWHIDL